VPHKLHQFVNFDSFLTIIFQTLEYLKLDPLTNLLIKFKVESNHINLSGRHPIQMNMDIFTSTLLKIQFILWIYQKCEMPSNADEYGYCTRMDLTA